MAGPASRRARELVVASYVVIYRILKADTIRSFAFGIGVATLQDAEKFDYAFAWLPICIACAREASDVPLHGGRSAELE